MPADTGYGLDSPGYESRQGWGTFLLYKTSRPAQVLTRLPIKLVPGFISGVKRRGVILTAHLHLAPRLRVGGAVLLLHMPSLRRQGQKWMVHKNA
jgi:hypothetical protein